MNKEIKPEISRLLLLEEETSALWEQYTKKRDEFRKAADELKKKSIQDYAEYAQISANRARKKAFGVD